MAPQKSIDAWAGKAPSVPIDHRHRLVSAPIPDTDGHLYTVTKHPDGAYACVDETGKPDIRRVMHGHCHHIAGMLLAWENIEMAMPKSGRKSAKPKQKYVKLVNFLKSEKLRTNSIVTYNNPRVQEWVGRALRMVLNAIAESPGITRRALPDATGIHYNTIGRAVIDLLEVGLVIEDGIDDSSGNPRAKLYINPALLGDG